MRCWPPEQANNDTRGLCKHSAARAGEVRVFAAGGEQVASAPLGDTAWCYGDLQWKDAEPAAVIHVA